jgi:hypothetical protein
MATPTSLPAAFTAGQVLTAAQMNDLRGAFRVLQVVNATTSTPSSNSTNTYADTGLTATITPSSTSSKVLVMVAQNGNSKNSGNSGNSIDLRIIRTSTDIGTIATASGFNGTDERVDLQTISAFVLDNPASTSAITYKTQFRNNTNAASVSVQLNNGLSTIILAEISA